MLLTLMVVDRSLFIFKAKFSIGLLILSVKEKFPPPSFWSNFRNSIVNESQSEFSFEQHLKEDKEYVHKEYKKRLIPIDFQSYIAIGLTKDGEEIKQKAKPLAVNVAQEYANSHRLIFSIKDLEFVTELERMTYTKTLSGDIVYRTLTERGGKSGADHFTSALLCAMLAWHRENEYINYTKTSKKKLFISRWIKWQNYIKQKQN